MTATLYEGGTYRISDSFYHLQGGRLFEGRVATNTVEGSISINPYFELKISSGSPVYMVKHILAGGRRVASVYEAVTDYKHAGLGCSISSDYMLAASGREIALGLLIVFIGPMMIVLLITTRCFTSQSFRKRKLRNILIIASCVILLIELSPFPIIESAKDNALDDHILTQAMQKILTSMYGKGKVLPSTLDKELFENKQALAKLDGIRLRFGPRAAKADDVLTNDVLYFHTDQLGSTRLITRQDGSIYQYMNYLPFGKILEGVTNGSVLSAFANFKNSYTGQEIDRSTGLYFYQSRFYDPEIGRFIQADTVIPEPADGQTFNRYTYVNNNPFKYTDPTGHFIAGLIFALKYLAVICVQNFIPAAFTAVFAYMATCAVMSLVTGVPIDPGQGMGSAAGGGVLGCLDIPGLKEIMLAFALVQLAISISQGNGDQAMLGFVVGLATGYAVGKMMGGSETSAGGSTDGAQKPSWWQRLWQKKPNCELDPKSRGTETGPFSFHFACGEKSDMDITPNEVGERALELIKESPDAKKWFNEVLSKNKNGTTTFETFLKSDVKIDVYICNNGNPGQTRWEGVFRGKWTGQPDQSIGIASWKFKSGWFTNKTTSINNAARTLIHETAHWTEAYSLGQRWSGDLKGSYDTGDYVTKLLK